MQNVQYYSTDFLQSVLHINVVIKMLWDCHQVSHLGNISAILCTKKRCHKKVRNEKKKQEVKNVL